LARVSEDGPFEERRLLVRQFVVGIVVGTDTLTVRAKYSDSLAQTTTDDTVSVGVSLPR